MSDAAVEFRNRFGLPPLARTLVPGRVNLIGDHIDYCGLPVLPAALQKRVRLHIRPRADRRIHVESMAARGPRTFEIVDPIPPYAPGDWGNYVKAAVAGIADTLREPVGFDALLDSDLPQSAGLSSSSAIVIACALALLHVNSTTIEPVALAERMAAAERYVGTHGGGMDQAVILLAHERHALRIEFEPLRARAIVVPPGWAFVVANSLAAASKSGPAREAYNSRPAEADAARRHVAALLAVPDASYARLIRDFALADLIDAAARAPDPVHRDRFLHVVSEAARVDAAVRALEQDDILAFGALMNESHESLRTRCAVSHPRLDRLVAECRNAGAIGARLTGAGFGGCVVALTNASGRDELLAALKAGFHEPRGRTPAEIDRLLFAVEPSAGARVERCA